MQVDEGLDTAPGGVKARIESAYASTSLFTRVDRYINPGSVPIASTKWRRSSFSAKAMREIAYARNIVPTVRATDCICTNEVAYYPPLTRLENFAAGVSTEAEFKGRGLGSRWSAPNSRSAYMGTFAE